MHEASGDQTSRTDFAARAKMHEIYVAEGVFCCILMLPPRQFFYLYPCRFPFCFVAVMKQYCMFDYADNFFDYYKYCCCALLTIPLPCYFYTVCTNTFFAFSSFSLFYSPENNRAISNCNIYLKLHSGDWQV